MLLRFHGLAYFELRFRSVPSSDRLVLLYISPFRPGSCPHAFVFFQVSWPFSLILVGCIIDREREKRDIEFDRSGSEWEKMEEDLYNL